MTAADTVEVLVETPTVPVLALENVTAGYGRAVVLREVTLAVPPGKIVALLGPNGAGKTTLLRTACGLLRPIAGHVLLDGDDVTRQAPNRRARRGLCLIPEGRGVFRSLTVHDNLRLAQPRWVAPDAARVSFERALEAFPILAERRDQLAGSLSGGQQQMLALARAYLAQPKVVLLDEVSMGLAPKIVDEIFEALRALAATGVALLLVEQYVTRAMDMADHVVLLDRGQITYDGPPSGLEANEVLKGYLRVDIDVTP